MKRSVSFPAVLMFSVVVTFLLANLSSAKAGGGNCQTKLAGNSYTCVVTFSDSPPADDCFEFATGGLSSLFDLHREEGDLDYGCACQTTGSSKSPSFDASANAFECAADPVGEGFEITGKVKGHKLSGQANNSTGESAVFTCTLSATPCF